MVVSSYHTTYAPFGSVLSSTGSGQRTGYIGREADNETGLGNYGVRLYEPEYGRFMSVDVLWGEYEGWQAYQYALNAPLSFRDEGGKWVQAMNEAARDAIRNSVPAKFRSAIQFSESGVVLKEPLLAAARGQDVNSNVAILSRLVENDAVISVNVSEAFNYALDGKDRRAVFYRGETSYNEDDTKFNPAFTLIPVREPEAEKAAGVQIAFSKSGKIEVYIASHTRLLTPLSKGQLAAHELFSHVRRYLLWKIGKASGFWHTDPGTDKAATKAEESAVKIN